MFKRYAKECYNRYMLWLTKKPYVSNMVTTSALMAFGDITAQKIIKKDQEPYSPMRTARMAFLGIALVTPAVLTLYRVMEVKIGASNPWLKVIIDQVLFSPTLLFVFMASLDLISGRSVEYAKNHIKDDYTSILKANWTFWPAVQIINFMLIPLHLRLLVVQCVALFWNTYLAWKLHSHDKI